MQDFILSLPNYMKLACLKILIALLFIYSCTLSNNEEKLKIKILATTSIIKDYLDNILPNSEFEVNYLMGPGIDPHTYKMTQGDIALLQKADLVVYNGLHLEGKMTDVLSSLKKKNKALALSDGIENVDLIFVDNKKHIADPHIWMDIKLTIKALEYSSQELKNKYSKDSINIMWKNYHLQLIQAESEVKQLFEQIDTSQRILVSTHDAFNYFGRAYQFKVRGLKGISTAADYGIKDMNQIIDFVVNKKVKAIFIENSVASKPMESIIERCTAKKHQVKLGGELYTDALGSKGSGAETYIKMCLLNAHTLNKSLK